MICVSIGRGRHRHMIAEHRHLVEQGAKLVELRLDYINGEVNLKRLLADRPCPVVITCRRERDGGKCTGSEEQRLMLLRTAIAEGVEYVDLEEDIAGQIPRFGKTQADHQPARLPQDARRPGGDPPPAVRRWIADIVKICTMANHPHDNLRMLRAGRAAARCRRSGCAWATSASPSRILAGRFGRPFTYATFHHERALAPGQLSFEQMTEVYHYDEINRETEVYGVIADPIGHSLSPLIHNAAFRASEAEQGLRSDPRAARGPGAVHRRRAGAGHQGPQRDHPAQGSRWSSKLTEADGAVRGIGAANTVVFDGDERLGYNTDYRAAMDSLEEAIGAAATRRATRLKGKTALVLGAGGVGKAIAYGLIRRGAKVVLTDGVPGGPQSWPNASSAASIDWSLRHIGARPTC